MKRRLIWILLLAVPLGILVTLPASLFLSTQEGGVQFQQVSGTVWSGEARLKRPQQSPLPVSWRWGGGFGWDWSIESRDLAIQGQWRLFNRNRLENITGQIGVQYLDIAQWLVVIWPEGEMIVDVSYIEFEPGVSLAAFGEVVWQQARLAGLVNEPLGDLRVNLRPHANLVGYTTADIQSNRSGAVRVSGELSSNSDRYEATIRLRPSPERLDLLPYLLPLGRFSEGAIKIERSGQLGVFE